jgi:N-acetylmuramoyl-L-alanine amidase
MTPHYIILHTAAATNATPEQVDGWHRDRGFRRDPHRLGHLRHIGYTYYIEKSGAITACRDEDETGAHCAHGTMNRQSLGICLEGHGDREIWTEAQGTSLLGLLRDIYTRHPLIAVRGTAALVGHREVPGVHKTCPGRLVDMDGMRSWYGALVVGYGVKPLEALPLSPMP